MTSAGARANLIKLLVLATVSILLIACETVSYYTQATRGQLAIVFGREDIQRLLDSDSLDPELRQKFSEVLRIRAFAEQELGLPVGRNYSSYVDVRREHVVWNVFAAPEFSIDPVNWCYPVAGCVSYRGYFSEEGALRFAAGLAADGYDVYTGGVDAYSTLGWFEDSLLSTVINRANYQLAGLIFHEMAHQILYLPGDTTFNESFATAVEREGIRRWLQHSGQVDTIAEAETGIRRQAQFIDLVSDYRSRFEDLYLQELSDQAMRTEKNRLQRLLREDYDKLKESWQGYSGYDDWFAQSLNNAQLSTVSSYNDLVPFFNDLLSQHGGELEAFYRAVREIAALQEEERAQRLAPYL